MSNFNIFQPDYLSRLLDPFLPGAAPHITPIAYQAITPDIFVLMFRTTNQEGAEFYFVSVEYDHMQNLDVVADMVEAWAHTKVKHFMTPNSKPDGKLVLEDMQVETSGPYLAVLAIIERPKDFGYWSEYKIILPDQKIDDAIPGLDEGPKGTLQGMIDGLTKGEKGPRGVNTTGYTISVYLRPDGSVEFFYN